VWATEPTEKTGSYSFSTSGCDGWTTNNAGSYCGCYGHKSKDFYVINKSISNFSGVDFSTVLSPSVKIEVVGLTNSGTNSYTVSLVDKDGAEIGTPVTKANGLGSGNNSNSAKSSSVTLTPVKGTTGYVIKMKGKGALKSTSYTLTYTEDSRTLESIGVSGDYITSFYVGDDFTFGGTVTAYYDDDSKADVTENADFTDYDMSTAGAQTVTVSYGGKTTTYDITVSVRPRFTVTYSDGGSVTEETGGSGVTLATRSSVGVYTFEGWAESNVPSETTDKPTIYTGLYKPNSNITLYPVYKRVGEGETVMPVFSTTISAYATAHSWSSAKKYLTMELNDYLTAVAEDNGGTNTGKYYSGDGSWRIYSSESGTVTINVVSGFELTSVTLTYSEGAFTYNDVAITSGSSVNVSGTSAEFVCTTKALINSIVVNYKQIGTNYYTSNPVASVSVTLGTNGYATFASSLPLDLTTENLPAGLSAYKASINNSIVEFTSFNQTVPENTGIMLKGDNGESYDITVVASGTTVTGNAFLVNTSGTTFDADEGFNYFGLKKGTLIFGLFDPTTVAIPADKAYLKVAETQARELICVFDDGETTGINNVERMAIENDCYYNLAGQRVAQPTKGLYIVNGKKVIIK